MGWHGGPRAGGGGCDRRACVSAEDPRTPPQAPPRSGGPPVIQLGFNITDYPVIQSPPLVKAGPRRITESGGPGGFMMCHHDLAPGS
eukprot:749544-Hanusia_phi.AAC.1